MLAQQFAGQAQSLAQVVKNTVGPFAFFPSQPVVTLSQEQPSSLSSLQSFEQKLPLATHSALVKSRGAANAARMAANLASGKISASSFADHHQHGGQGNKHSNASTSYQNRGTNDDGNSSDSRYSNGKPKRKRGPGRNGQYNGFHRIPYSEKCPHCSNIFKDEARFNVHKPCYYQKAIEDNPALRGLDQRTWPPGLSYKCLHETSPGRVCGAVAKTLPLLVSHTRCHVHGFVCEICGYRLGQPPTAIYHVKSKHGIIQSPH